MLSRKINLIVGLTTFHNEMLRISVPALSQIRGKFLLIIYNDNPSTPLRGADVRRLGYRGALRIINTGTNVGPLRARLGILSHAAVAYPNARWITFLNDDDVLFNLDVPAVESNNFAVIQNALSVRGRVSDLLRGAAGVNDIDGENIVLLRPHLGMAGTLIRADIAYGLCRHIFQISDKVQEIDDSLDYIPPFDAMMWSFANIYARHRNASACPIYMDSINYIKNDLDCAAQKYGRPAVPSKNIAAQYAHAIARYDAAFQAYLANAAPAGQ